MGPETGFWGRGRPQPGEQWLGQRRAQDELSSGASGRAFQRRLRTSFPAASPGPRDSSRTESYDRLKRARWPGEGIKQLIAPPLTVGLVLLVARTDK
ncbi:hypothetical protein VNO77_27129 [Canavalia gladiata]|uniref:Uncharacterized protein n=1 Tax=Canavalia gladiata TaxID=3824 RepID=A0AAN9Q673_CANGL